MLQLQSQSESNTKLAYSDKENSCLLLKIIQMMLLLIGR